MRLCLFCKKKQATYCNRNVNTYSAIRCIFSTINQILLMLPFKHWRILQFIWRTNKMSLFLKINPLQRDSFNINIKIVEFTAYSWNMIGTFLKTLIQNVSNVLFVIFLNNACSLLERVFDVRLYRLYIFSWSTQNSGRHSWYLRLNVVYP